MDDSQEPDQDGYQAQMQPHTRDAVARLAVSGVPIQAISQHSGVTETVLRRALKEDRDLITRMDVYRTRFMTRYAIHHAEMVDLLDQCRLNIQEGLGHNDIKVKMDTTWRVVDNVIPKQAQQIDAHLEVTATHEVTGHLEALVAHLGDLRQVQGTKTNGGFRDRVKVGAKALPGPISLEPAPVTTPDLDETVIEVTD